MICKQQALLRNDFTGAASSEDDDGVLEAGLVDAVDIFSRQLEPHLGHGANIEFLDERQQPHALISPCL